MAKPPFLDDLDIPLLRSPYMVHDGDTYYPTGLPDSSLRNLGYNSPEVANPNKSTPDMVGGREAQAALAELLNAYGVHQDIRGKGYYGRDLDYTNNGDVANAMIRQGAAIPSYRYGGPLSSEEIDQLEYSRDAALNDYRHGVSNAHFDASRNVPLDPYRGVYDEPTRYRSKGLVGGALARGTDQMQGNLYGGAHTLTRLAESVTGADLSGVKNWAQEGADRNEAEAAMSPARFNSYKDVKGIGDWIPYAVEKAAESAPHMIPYLVGGGIGGVVGKTALGRVAGGVVGQAATRQAAKTVASDLVEKTAKDTLYKWGARAGATAAGTIGHAGEIENEMTQAGGYEVPAWQTLAASVARAGLDTFGMETVLSRVVGETAAKSAMDVAKNVAKGMGIGALAEGPTEAAQEAIAIGLRAVHDPNYDWQADAPDRLMESLIAGAAAGGLTSGVGSGAKATVDALGARSEKPADTTGGGDLTTDSNSDPNIDPGVDPTGDMVSPNEDLDPQAEERRKNFVDQFMSIFKGMSIEDANARIQKVEAGTLNDVMRRLRPNEYEADKRAFDFIFNELDRRQIEAEANGDQVSEINPSFIGEEGDQGIELIPFNSKLYTQEWERGRTAEEIHKGVMEKIPFMDEKELEWNITRLEDYIKKATSVEDPFGNNEGYINRLNKESGAMITRLNELKAAKEKSETVAGTKSVAETPVPPVQKLSPKMSTPTAQKAIKTALDSAQVEINNQNSPIDPKQVIRDISKQYNLGDIKEDTGADPNVDFDSEERQSSLGRVGKFLKHFGFEVYQGDKHSVNRGRKVITIGKGGSGLRGLANSSGMFMSQLFRATPTYQTLTERSSKKVRNAINVKLDRVFTETLHEEIAAMEKGVLLPLDSDPVKGSIRKLIKQVLEGDYRGFEVSPSEGTKKVDLQEAFSADPDSAGIVSKLSDSGFVITGSIALAPEGSLYRSANNLLHDVDVVAPIGFPTSLPEIAASVQKLFKEGGDVAPFRAILGKKGVTTSYLIPGKGYTLEFVESTGLTGYDSSTTFKLYKDGNFKGKLIAPTRGEVKYINEVGKAMPADKAGVRLLDVFPSEARAFKNASVDIEGQGTKQIKFATADTVFDAKLNPNFSRHKDNKDYALFKLSEENRGEGIRLFDKNGKALGWYNKKTKSIGLSDEILEDLRGTDILAKAKALETVAHEIGHHAVRQFLDGASDAVKAQIDKDYQAYLDEFGDVKTDAQLRKAMAGRQTILRGLNTLYNKDVKVKGRKDYILSKNEWLADEAAKFLLNPEEVQKWSQGTQTIIRKIADFMKALITAFMKHTYRVEGDGIKMFFRELEAAAREAGVDTGSDMMFDEDLTESPNSTVSIVPTNTKDAVSGMRANYGNAHLNNTKPGEAGWLGNPHKWAGNGGPKNVTVDDAIRAFKNDFVKKIKEDKEFREAVIGLRGKQIGYYEPNAEKSHVKGIQTFLANLTDEQIRAMGVEEKVIENPTETKQGKVDAAEKSINIWYGSNENPELSNLATRPFIYDDKSYRSVEHAYQTLKSGTFDEDAYNSTALKPISNKKVDTKTNEQLAKDLITVSFKQNPEALEKLLATGDTPLTHTQGDKFWSEAFPRILSDVRSELKGSKKPTRSIADKQQVHKLLTKFKGRDIEEVERWIQRATTDELATVLRQLDTSVPVESRFYVRVLSELQHNRELISQEGKFVRVAEHSFNSDNPKNKGEYASKLVNKLLDKLEAGESIETQISLLDFKTATLVLAKASAVYGKEATQLKSMLGQVIEDFRTDAEFASIERELKNSAQSPESEADIAGLRKEFSDAHVFDLFQALVNKRVKGLGQEVVLDSMSKEEKAAIRFDIIVKTARWFFDTVYKTKADAALKGDDVMVQRLTDLLEALNKAGANTWSRYLVETYSANGAGTLTLSDMGDQDIPHAVSVTYLGPKLETTVYTDKDGTLTEHSLEDLSQGGYLYDVFFVDPDDGQPKGQTVKAFKARMASYFDVDAEELRMERLPDGRYIAIPEGIAAEDYMLSNTTITLVPVDFDGRTQAYVKKESRYSFGEIAANDGMMDVDVHDFISKYTNREHVDTAGQETKLTKQEGFRAGKGVSNNQIDVLGITMLGRKMLSLETLSSPAQIKRAFVTGISRLLSLGYEFPMTREGFDFRDKLVIHRKGSRKYTWGEIKNYSFDSDFYNLLDGIEANEPDPLLDASMEEWLKGHLYDLVQSASPDTRAAIKDDIVKLKNSLGNKKVSVYEAYAGIRKAVIKAMRNMGYTVDEGAYGDMAGLIDIDQISRGDTYGSRQTGIADNGEDYYQQLNFWEKELEAELQKVLNPSKAPDKRDFMINDLQSKLTKFTKQLTESLRIHEEAYEKEAAKYAKDEVFELTPEILALRDQINKADAAVSQIRAELARAQNKPLPKQVTDVDEARLNKLRDRLTELEKKLSTEGNKNPALVKERHKIFQEAEALNKRLKKSTGDKGLINSLRNRLKDLRRVRELTAKEDVLRSKIEAQLDKRKTVNRKLRIIDDKLTGKKRVSVAEIPDLKNEKIELQAELKNISTELTNLTWEARGIRNRTAGSSFRRRTNPRVDSAHMLDMQEESRTLQNQLVDIKAKTSKVVAEMAKEKAKKKPNKEALADYQDELDMLKRLETGITRRMASPTEVMREGDNDSVIVDQPDYGSDTMYKAEFDRKGVAAISKNHIVSRLDETLADNSIPEVQKSSSPVSGWDVGIRLLSDRLAAVLDNLLDIIGIPVKVHGVNLSQIELLKRHLVRVHMPRLIERRKDYDDRAGDDVEQRVAAIDQDISRLKELMESLDNTTNSQIIYNDHFNDVLLRTPIIIINDKGNSATQIKHLAHELGHLIKRQFVDELILKAQNKDGQARSAVEELFGSVNWNDPAEALMADERFANMMVKWALSDKKPRSIIEKFFSNMGKTLRKLYDGVKNLFTSSKEAGEFASFERFMDTMIARRDHHLMRNNAKQVWRLYDQLISAQTHGPFMKQRKDNVFSHDYTAEEFLQDTAKKAKEAYNWTSSKPVIGVIPNTLTATANIFGKAGPYVQAVGVSMRELGAGMDSLAQHWGIMPGESAPNTRRRVRFLRNPKTGRYRYTVDRVAFKTIPEEMRSLLADGIHDQLAKVIKQLPGIKGLDYLDKNKRMQAVADNKKIARELQHFTINKADYNKLSDPAKKVVDYFNWLYGKFVNSSDWAFKMNFNPEYFPLVIDKDKWNLHSQQVIVAINEELKVPIEEAIEIWKSISDSNGVIDPNIKDVLPSGVTAKKDRKWPDSLRDRLHKIDVYSDDLHQTIGRYTHQLVKRVVEQSRFADYKRNIDGTLWTDPDTGVPAFSPVAEIDRALTLARYAKGAGVGGISGADYIRVRDVYIRALRGTLGAEIDPTWNTITSYTQLGMTIALLPLAVFSSVADLAGVGVQANRYKQPLKLLGDIKTTAKLILDSPHKQHLTQLAKTLGVINDRTIDHVLSESMASEYMTPTTKRISETFFEVIQMKRWTDFTRILATEIGIQTLKEYGAMLSAGNQGEVEASIKDLSIDSKELKAWYDNGASYGDLTHYPSVANGLARWVDFAILRPEAALRPPVGSDRRFALFWQLKEFMYTFYYITMKNAWNQMKNEEGFARALPGIALAAMVLPLAMLGYELRKLLAEEMVGELIGEEPKYKKPEGEDYMYEMIVRGGLLGPMTVLHDMYEQDKHGSLALSALMGPAFSKTVEFFDKDFASFLVSTTPGFAQSRVLRDTTRPVLQDILPFQD